MWDRAWGGAFRRGREGRAPVSRKPPTRSGRRPRVETLEGRLVLNASLGGISPVQVPSGLGYQVALDGSGSSSTTQTFAATSSNPDIKVSVAQGEFLTLNLSHTSSGQAGDPSFTGPVTFQLFNDLTPKTASLIESFVQSGFYNGKTIHRVAADFSGTGGPTDYVIQGGAPNPDGTGSSGLPGTPYGLELNQQVTFVNPGSLAIANTGQPNSNDTQFFFTTGPQTHLDFNYTDFGQVVAGQSTIAKIEQVATQPNSGLGGEKSLPVSPITITSATLSTTNPNGVLHVDATGAVPGETATVQVTATDPTTKTTALQTFQVSVVPDTTPHPATLTFSPVVSPVAANATAGQATTVTLSASNANPNNTAVKNQFALVTQPAHGTLSQFNPTAGTVVYTPNAGFTGTDTFQYTAAAVGGSPSPVYGNIGTVALSVGTAPPVIATPVSTGAVRVVGTVLVITPLPRTDKGVNQILVGQLDQPSSPASARLTVSINGQTDINQPLSSSIDRIIVYGSKASDHVTIDPSVDPTIRVTLDGGQGGSSNGLKAGAGPTREHGWFGQNTLAGGTGPNQLVGRAGHVHFLPTSTTDEIFAGVPHPGYSRFHHYNGRTSLTVNPPGGTFYRFVAGRLVPIGSNPAPASGAKSTQATGSTTTA